MGFEVGQRVRVSASIIMYHYPTKRNEAFDVQGLEGIIQKDITMKDGVQLTATAPFFVKFLDHAKFKAHFSEDEIELIEESEEGAEGAAEAETTGASNS